MGLNTASLRGGMITRAPGECVSTAAVDGLLVVDAIADEARDCPFNLRQQFRHLRGILPLLLVTVEAMIWPWSSTPRCSFFQLLRFFSPCFWVCHSP